MKLHYRTLGEGAPLLILHGLFGSGDNWQSLARQYAEHFKVYLIDQRNHGRSPHSDDFSYQLMADDLFELVESEGLDHLRIIGHSMGGKTAMLFASQHGALMEKLIVADMAPKPYPVHHGTILKGLTTADLIKLGSRGAVDKHLKEYIPQPSVRQFLLKNLYWKEKGRLAWRFNVEVLDREIERIVEATDQQICLTDTLFIRGSESDYITDDDTFWLEHYFPNHTLRTIEGAGHWLHAEAPEEFFELSHTFLSDI